MPVEPDNTIEPANPPPAPEPRTAQPVARNSWRKAAGVALGLLGVVLMVGCVVSKEYGALAKALVMTYVGVSMYRNPAPQAPPARAPLSRGFLWTIAILFGLILLVIAVSLIA